MIFNAIHKKTLYLLGVLPKLPKLNYSIKNLYYGEVILTPFKKPSLKSTFIVMIYVLTMNSQVIIEILYHPKYSY